MESIVESPILLGIAVFVTIFLVFFLIRLFADWILVAIALGSAVLSYHIHQFYPEFLMILQESGLLEILKITLPEQPDNLAILMIAGLITTIAIIISLPILPFSVTYRFLLGVEPSIYAQKKIQKLIGKEVKQQLPAFLEKKVQKWIHQEVQKNLQDSIQRENDPKLGKSAPKKRKPKLQIKPLTQKLFKKLKFWQSRIPKTLSVKNMVKRVNVKKDNQPSQKETEPKTEPKAEPKAEPKTQPKTEPKTEPKAVALNQ
jgi:hypothetical protein